MPVSLKISDLSFINGANLTDSDLFLVTDTESRTSKKLSFRTLKSVINDDLTLGGLRGIDLSTIPPLEGDFLKFEGGRFVPGTFSLNSLGELDDIDLSVSPTDGQVLVWEGASSKFKPVTIFIPDASDYYNKTEVDAAIANVTVDLSDYYTKSEVDTAISNVSVDLSGYYTSAQIDAAGYLTSVDLDSYYTKTEVDTAIAAATGTDLSNYYTKAEVDTAVAGVTVDLSGYYTKTETDTLLGNIDLSLYYTKTEIDNANYASESYVDTAVAGVTVDLSGYYTKTEIDAAGYLTSVNLGDLGDVSIMGTPTTGHVLKWDGSSWSPAADSGGGGGGGIALNDLSVATNAVIGGSGGLSYNNVTGVFTFTQATKPDASNFDWNASLIPDTNAQYDLGSAEYKVRHLFLSDNSIKFESGDLGIDNGKVHFEGQPLATEAYVDGKGYLTSVSGDIDVDKVYFKNVFATLADLPDPGTYHGMFAHVHATGAAYFAHAGNWIELANEPGAGTYALATDLTSLQTIVNNLDIDNAAGTLNSLSELSAALNDDPNYVSDLATRITTLENAGGGGGLSNIADDSNGGVDVTGVIDTTEGVVVASGGKLEAPGANLDFSNTIVNFQGANITGLSSTINDQIDFKLDRYNATDGQVLTWDGNNSQFIWTTPATGGGGGIDLTDLSVTVNPATGSGNLEFDNTTGVFSYTPPTIPTPGGGGGATTLDGLLDVSTSGVTNGQVLKYNGSAWAPADDIDTDTNVDLTSVTSAIQNLTEFQNNLIANTAVSALDFTANNTTGSSPLSVSLNVSYVGNAQKFDVDWGDGNTDTNVNSNQLNHTYNEANGGQFDVTVTARNTSGVGFGSSSTEGKVDYITLYTPAFNLDTEWYAAATGGSELTSTNKYVLAGSPIYLENTSTNISGVNAQFEITWGDGTIDLVTADDQGGGADGNRAAHTYASPPHHGGEYGAILKITSHDTSDPSLLPATYENRIKVFDPNIAAPTGLESKLQGVSGSVAKLCSGYTNNDASDNVAVGTLVTRVDSGTASTNMSGFAYNAESGKLRSRRNGNDTGLIDLSQPHGTNISDGELQLYQESDYNPYASNGSSGLTFAYSLYYPGLYKGFKARTNSVVSHMPDGVNTLQLSHDETGDSNIVRVCKDSDVNPTVDLSGATLVETHNGAQRFVSGIPHYAANNPSIEFRGIKVNNLTGQMYPSANSDIITVTDSVSHEGVTFNAIGTKTFNYSAIDGAVTMLDGIHPLANTTDYTIGDISINTLSNTKAAKTLKVRAKNANGYSNYVTFTDTIVQVFSSAQSTVNISEQNIFVPSALGNGAYTDGGVRIYDFKSQTTDTPTFNSAYNFYINNPYSESADPGVAGSSEASVRFGNLQHNVTDYSTGYLPVGPDRSGDTGTQYFTFAFRRQVVANFGIYIVSGGIAGCWIAAPGTAIDSSSGLNGWLDTSQAYAGSGVPGAFASQGGNGSDGCATNNSARILTNTNLNGTYNMTLGEENMSNATGNVVLVRVALNAGQEITQLQIREAN